MAHPVSGRGSRTQVVRSWNGPTLGWLEVDQPTNIVYLLSGLPGGGIRPAITIPMWLTVTSWLLLSNEPGSIVIDIWRVPQETWLAGTVPTVANSITGSDKPTLAGAVGAQSFALTGWNTELNQNDVLLFNVESITAVINVTLTLRCLKLRGIHQ